MASISSHRIVALGRSPRTGALDLERVGLEWAEKVCRKSPTAQRMLKYAFNLPDDGMVGQQVFAGEATRMGYMTDEAVEGRNPFLQKRDPDWSPYPYHF